MNDQNLMFALYLSIKSNSFTRRNNSLFIVFYFNCPLKIFTNIEISQNGSRYTVVGQFRSAPLPDMLFRVGGELRERGTHGGVDRAKGAPMGAGQIA